MSADAVFYVAYMEQRCSGLTDLKNSQSRKYNETYQSGVDGM